MTNKYATGRFCCQSCANSRKHSKETRQKISNTLNKNKSNYNYANKKYEKTGKDIKRCNYGMCPICGKKFEFKRNKNNVLIRRKTCSDECLKKIQTIKGMESVKKQQRRSKNEIYFYELCQKYFNNVKNNECIFNGWDADVIIEDIKYAILWNGIWHYKQIYKRQSLKQVQTRDKIKIDNIIKCGYTPYIIKDMGKENKKFVEEQFEIFISKLKNNLIIANRKDYYMDS